MGALHAVLWSGTGGQIEGKKGLKTIENTTKEITTDTPATYTASEVIHEKRGITEIMVPIEKRTK